MEAKGGVGEFRRLHIIYFLCRTGRIEQPHLFRVTHLQKNGVYLRDVKRWLSDLRGKDMPDSFSWSYKRRYKNGYVWQDLLEDDLITPISDNEFVLKGSEIVPSSLDYLLNNDKKGCSVQQSQEEHKSEFQTPMEASPESASFGSERSSVTEDSTKDEKILNDHDNDDENSLNISPSPSLYSVLMKKSEINNNKDDVVDDDHIGTFARSPFAKSKSYSGFGVRASLFRNLLTCGTIDANESVLVTRNNNQPDSQISKGEKLGGSARVYGTCWNQNPHSHIEDPRRSHDGTQKESQSQTNVQKKQCYRPVHGPTCSQCGKSFKPEKLHKHMKSCKGLKAMARNAAQKIPTHKSASDESATTTSSYFLTN